MQKRIFIFLITFLSISFSIQAQVDYRLIKKQRKIADNYAIIGNFSNAILLYERFLENDTTNSDLNFQIGFCYLNTSFDKSKALPYLKASVANILPIEKDITNQNAVDDVYFFLIQAYRVNYLFQEAIDEFDKIKPLVEQNKLLMSGIMDEIEMCKTGVKLMENPVNMYVTHLGETINSEAQDHSPVISADESMLIFTSRRKGSTGGIKDFNDEFYEDIYYSINDGNGWSTPKNIGDSINSDGHEASIGLSPDGQKLFIYKDDKEKGSIYVSELQGDIWTRPKKMSNNINSKKSRETHASISADGKYLYFTSDRKGGFGGMDIYKSKKLPNGQWGLPLNLGPKVNTKKDEEGPSIHPDGTSLYFSSKGHKGIGGFDIFVSKKDENGFWDNAENIGYPINTTGDDIFYLLTPDGKRSYYSSQQLGSIGQTDIYSAMMPEVEEKPISVISGVIAICRGQLPNMRINVYDAKTNDPIGIYRPNTKSGKYLIVLNRGTIYNINYLADGEIVHSEKLDLPNDAAYKIVKDTLNLESEVPCGFWHNGVYYDQLIDIKNILFPSGKAGKISSNKNLDKLADYLLDNPEAIVEIGAYADEQGSEKTNIKLTKKRAISVKNYLVSKKVDKKQLQAVGYGEANPIAINKNPNGTWNKKAMKYNRRIEFKLIKQGKKKLLVKSIDDVPEKYKIK